MVYKLLKLTLLLPIANANVERVFSAMKVVKSNLCNKMDDVLNNCLITYTERNILLTISNDIILAHFQQIDRRRDFHCNVVYQTTMLFLIFNIVCIIFSLKI